MDGGVEREPSLTAAWLIGVDGCGGKGGVGVGVPDVGGSTSSSATPGSSGGTCSLQPRVVQFPRRPSG